MTEPLNTPDTQSPQESPGARPMSLKARLGLGTALVVLPVGTYMVYSQLKDAGDVQNQAEEQGATYDVSALAKVDPALIKYHLLGQIATGLQAPRAIAVDAKGRILVAGDRMIRILNTKGETLHDITLADAPFCLAAGAQGAIYVGFKDHVEVYNAAGERTAVWNSLGDKSLLTGLAVQGQELYAADAGRRLVVRCALDGKVLGELGKNDGDGGLVLPSPFLNVASAANGQIMVSNPGRHRVETYSPDGQLQHFFGKPGTAIANFIGCCNPSHLALLSDGRIVTAEKGVARVKIFHPDGRLDCVVAGPDMFANAHRGLELAVDGANHVLVLEPGTTSVRIFAPNAETSDL